MQTVISAKNQFYMEKITMTTVMTECAKNVWTNSKLGGLENEGD